MIILIPHAGLCNRMRAIDSAVELSQEIGQKLKIYWIQNSVLNCPFHDLFETFPNSLAEVINVKDRPFWTKSSENIQFAPIRFIFKNFQKIYLDRLLLSQEVNKLYHDNFDFRKLATHKNLLIESQTRFFGGKTTPMYQYFKPVLQIEKEIKKVTQRFSEHTIGVHIRRSDNEKSTSYSPLKLFIQVMYKEIEFEPQTTFFVASDSEDTKKKLYDIFGNKVVYSTSKIGDRDSKEGMQQAVVDLYALSKTKKVLGSYWSSFSHTATHISDIEEVVIKKDILPSKYGI